MRHNKKFNHLGRQAAHRGAMLSNMSTSLIMHKRIFTTTAKAKALKIVVEPLITKAKEDTTANRRLVFAALQQKEAVTELFQVVAPKVGDRPGGYTRIIKTGFRLGDNAAMCFIELVDFNDNMLKAKVEKKAKTRRSSVKKKADAVEVAPINEKPTEKAAPVAEEVVAQEEVVETPIVETPAAEAPAAE
ncbi:MAG TPA: 50S ribosomal protein L17 [Bacteroidales bacterium]|nr:50S ribosomal protein L17 [Bacteroidales bacterium]